MAKSLRGEESQAPVSASRPAPMPIDALGAALQVEMASRPDNSPASSRPLGTPPIYDTIAHLARGKIADVSLALARGDAVFRKLVAIKRFRPDVRDTGGLKRFLTEARLAARFDHPNIVRTHEVVQTGGTWLMVMEFLDGQPLSRIIKRAAPDGGIPFGIHLKIVADALAGLHAVHELCDEGGTPLEIVHRDVTSHNVFVCYRGETKLIDFGMATDKFTRSRMTSSIRTKDSASTTQVVAKAEPLDRQADLFAMGTMLWEVAAGPSSEPEVDGDEETTIFKRGTSDLALRSLSNAARKGLLRICERALSSDPTDRFSSAAEMQWEIEGVLRELGTPITSGEVQEYVGSLFADERARLKHLLTVQFSKGGNASRLDEMLESSSDAPRRTPLPPAAAPLLPPLHEAPFAPSYDSMVPTVIERPLPTGPATSAGPAGAAFGTTAHRAAPKRPKTMFASFSRPVVLAAPLALLGATLLVLLVVRVRQPARSARAVTNMTSAPAAIAPAPTTPAAMALAAPSPHPTASSAAVAPPVAGAMAPSVAVTTPPVAVTTPPVAVTTPPVAGAMAPPVNVMAPPVAGVTTPPVAGVMAPSVAGVMAPYVAGVMAPSVVVLPGPVPGPSAMAAPAVPSPGVAPARGPAPRPRSPIDTSRRAGKVPKEDLFGI